MKTEHLLHAHCGDFTLPKSSESIRTAWGALKWLTCRSVIWSRRAGSSSAWSHWDISSWTETTYFNWFLTLIFHCFQTSQPMPQTHTGSYKGSLTDFLNTFRASKRNLSYNNGFMRLKIIIIKIITIIHPQKSRFFHSTALEDSNSAETIISQAALLSQGTKPAFLSLLPSPKTTSKLAEKLQTCCCPCVPWQGGEPWDHQDQCWKHQSGMAWDARNRQRWQHCHPQSSVSQSLAQTLSPLLHHTDKQHSSSAPGSAIRWRQANGENLYQFLCKCF